jgi:hypothetical protein
MNEAILQTAQEPVFKTELVTHPHWLSYGLVLSLLCVFLIVLAKKSKKGWSHTLKRAQNKCKLVEHIILNNKTKVYVLDYQGQGFLLADNQHSLALHPLGEQAHE